MKRAKPRGSQPLDNPKLPKYSIAVASDLSGVPQQQLRRMEEGGLLNPERSKGNMRRYSDDDMRHIAEVMQLAETGMNTAGIRAALESRVELGALRDEVVALRRENAALREEVERLRGGDALPRSHGRTKV